MFGLPTTVTFTRRDSRSGIVTWTKQARVLVQPFSLDIELTGGGEQTTARLSAPVTLLLEEGDTFSWQGRTWRVHNVSRTDGRGAMTRALCTSFRE